MNRQLLAVFVLLAVVAGTLLAVPAAVMRQQGPVFLTGLEDVIVQSVPPGERLPVTPLDEYTPGSIVDTLGWTWYDLQSNGTHGKQIGVDADGMVHVVWTNGVNNGSSIRHVYYNVWDPALQDFILGTGSQVNSASRAGFSTLAVDPEGWAYPVFHQVQVSGGAAHAAAAIDFLPGVGAFTTVEIPYTPDNAEVIWPHGALDGNGVLHTVSTKNTSSGATEKYYARGIPEFDGGYGSSINWGTGFSEADPAFHISMDIAASPVSQKVATAWIYASDGSISGRNVYIRVSENGGQTWGAAQNITNFQPIDTNCVGQIGDIAACNGDTLRPWLDLAVFIDRNDVVHVAFTASAWYYWSDDGEVGPFGYIYSHIYHWDEVNNEFSIVADGFYSPVNEAFSGLGANMLMCHRPSLAEDSLTGHFYCSYQLFDSLQISDIGKPMADAWVSVSTDGGRFWAAGTNVTNTNGGILTPAPGSKSERDITIAPWVTSGFIHMQYMMDHDAGTAVTSTPEGVATYNEMVYQRIPVADIATSPLLPPYPLRADSTGFPALSVRNLPGPVPQSFTLHQNYPNPFNPGTNIQFDLVQASRVSLKVHDVTGRQVAVLLDNAALGAGAHVMSFDASDLPSGVYFYRLEGFGTQLTKKMLLVK